MKLDYKLLDKLHNTPKYNKVYYDYFRASLKRTGTAIGHATSIGEYYIINI